MCIVRDGADRVLSLVYRNKVGTLLVSGSVAGRMLFVSEWVRSWTYVVC
jgi:hypothetical protein